MTDTPPPWDPTRIRTWLDRRQHAARTEQAAADRRGYEAQDDYDKAAAEEWAASICVIGSMRIEDYAP